MKVTNLRWCAAVVWAALIVWMPVAMAADERDPDDDVVAGATALNPGHPPITRSLRASGGVADVDWFRLLTRAYRSYEAVVTNSTDQTNDWSMARYDSAGTTLRQLSFAWGTTNHSGASTAALGIRILRWANEAPADTDMITTVKVTGDTTFTGITNYTIQFAETTLFCPRFNNSGAQTSILIIQSAMDGAGLCEYDAHFFNEAGAHLATQSGQFSETGSPSRMTVISTPTVPGVAGQKGSARIGHTCGRRGIAAKLVALEPSTGFSFDTACTSRD